MGETEGSEITSPTLKFKRLSLSQKSIRILGWMGLFIFTLTLFTYFKLPETHLKNFIHGSISSVLNAEGITFTAAKTSLSFGFGVNYKMKEIFMNIPNVDSAIQIDSLEISPSLLDFILGKVGGNFEIKNVTDSMEGTFSLKTLAKANILKTKIKFYEFNVGKLGLIPYFTGLKGNLMMNGKINFYGDISTPETWDGNGTLTLKKIIIEPQTLQGFNIPQVNIDEGELDLDFSHGKGLINNIKLGKTNSDDIQGKVTGDLTLSKTLELSTMNLKTNFTLSQNIIKSFVIIDAILGAGKQNNGSYAWNLNGPLFSPVAAPGKLEQ